MRPTKDVRTQSLSHSDTCAMSQIHHGAGRQIPIAVTRKSVKNRLFQPDSIITVPAVAPQPDAAQHLCAFTACEGTPARHLLRAELVAAHGVGSGSPERYVCGKHYHVCRKSDVSVVRPSRAVPLRKTCPPQLYYSLIVSVDCACMRG